MDNPKTYAAIGQFLLHVIVSAGQILKKHEGFHNVMKDADTYKPKIVTKMDLISNNFILHMIFPALFDLINEDSVLVLSEELEDAMIYSHSNPPMPLYENKISKNPDWMIVIDPLCGTIAYSKGLSDYVISLCLFYKNEPIWGGVLSPALNDIFYACKAQGAFYNGEKITTPKPPVLEDALVSIGHEVMRTNFSSTFGEMLVKMRRLRVAATCGLELCYVACGKVDAFIKENQPLYDYAAGMFILSEAVTQHSHLSKLSGENIRQPFSDSKLSFVAALSPLREEICSYTRLFK